MSNRVNFSDLFEYNNNNVLILKRRLIISENQYEIGDELIDNTLEFIENPEDYFYIVNPLRVGDTLEGFMKTN